MIVVVVAVTTWKHEEPMTRWLTALPEGAGTLLIFDSRRCTMGMSTLQRVVTALSKTYGWRNMPLETTKAAVGASDLVLGFHPYLISSVFTKAVAAEAVARGVPLIICEHDDASGDEIGRIVEYAPITPDRPLIELLGGV